MAVRCESNTKTVDKKANKAAEQVPLICRVVLSRWLSIIPDTLVAILRVL